MLLFSLPTFLFGGISSLFSSLSTTLFLVIVLRFHWGGNSRSHGRLFNQHPWMLFRFPIEVP